MKFVVDPGPVFGRIECSVNSIDNEGGGPPMGTRRFDINAEAGHVYEASGSLDWVWCFTITDETTETVAFTTFEPDA